MTPLSRSTVAELRAEVARLRVELEDERERSAALRRELGAAYDALQAFARAGVERYPRGEEGR